MGCLLFLFEVVKAGKGRNIFRTIEGLRILSNEIQKFG